MSGAMTGSGVRGMRLGGGSMPKVVNMTQSSGGGVLLLAGKAGYVGLFQRILPSLFQVNARADLLLQSFCEAAPSRLHGCLLL